MQKNRDWNRTEKSTIYTGKTRVCWSEGSTYWGGRERRAGVEEMVQLTISERVRWRGYETLTPVELLSFKQSNGRYEVRREGGREGWKRWYNLQSVRESGGGGTRLLHP